MKRHSLNTPGVASACLLGLLLALVTPAAQMPNGAGEAPAADPQAVVSAVYGDHFAHEQQWDETLKRNRARFAPELLLLLDKDARAREASPGEIVGLDFDPFTNMQEEASKFQVAGTTREGADAVVSVMVHLGAEHSTVRVRLTPSGRAWRITNVLYDEGDLVQLLKTMLAAAEPPVQTPESGSPQRKAILGALRVPVEKDLHQPVVFKIDALRVQDEWAFVRGVPQQPNGQAVDYSHTSFQEAIKQGVFDDGFCALLRRDGSEWRVVAYAIGASDVPWVGWHEEYKAPRSIFQ